MQQQTLWAERVPSAPYPMTVAQLAQLPDDGFFYELVEGRLIRMPGSGSKATRIVARLIIALGVFVQAHHLGDVTGPDGEYDLTQPGDPTETALIPDVAFVQAGRVPEIAWIASLPVGALATCVLVVNNLRDRETDVRAGKRTLAVRLGRRGAILEYAALLALAYAAPAWLFLVAGWRWPVLLPLLSLPLAAALLRAVATEEGRALNARLGGTARLLLVHGALLALGLVLAGGGR